MIVSAFPIAGGIQINRQIDAGTLSAEMVFEGDPGWLEAVGAAAQFGHGVVDHEPVAPTISLGAAQASARAAVNAVRGEVRLHFITALPGQDMVYLQKEREARDWVAGRALEVNAPDPADFPHLAGEVGVTAPDMDGVAQVYLNMAALFRRVSAVIEREVLTALTRIDAATTSEDATAAAAAFPPRLMHALWAAGAPV